MCNKTIEDSPGFRSSDTAADDIGRKNTVTRVDTSIHMRGRYVAPSSEVIFPVVLVVCRGRVNGIQSLVECDTNNDKSENSPQLIESVDTLTVTTVCRAGIQNAGPLL